VVNPVAGAGRGRRVWHVVEPLLRSRFTGLHCKLTTARGDAEKLAAGFAKAHPDGGLIIVGGDGSMHETINGLLDAGYEGALGIIPAGTGNDGARNLGISADPTRAAHLDFARAPAVDVARVSTCDPSGEQHHRWFLNSLSVGTSARANRIAGSIGGVIRGALKYPIAGVLALCSRGPARYEVRVGGVRQFDGAALNVSVANGSGFGGGLQISPQSRPDDGSLELVIIGAMSRMRALATLRALRSGGHLAMGEVHVTPTGSAAIEIRGRDSLAFEADGENLVSHQRLIVNLQPGRLRVAR